MIRLTLRSGRGLALLLVLARADAAERQVLHGHVPKAISHLQSAGRLPPSNIVELAISLPLRNPVELTSLLEQIYDPASTNFHRYLTPDQFAERFGPTVEDYEAVKMFAHSNHLAVTGTFDNRMIVDVAGAVPEIEKAFHVSMHRYPHPTEVREFYAPDVEPSVDLAVPLLEINGLNDYDRAHPLSHFDPQAGSAGASTGTGPGGNYRGNDFRNAYVPGVTLNGSGQMVGLVEFDRYYTSDITTYEAQAGLRNVPLLNVLVDSTNTIPSANSNSVGEVSLDIEMVISMAPNLSKLVVFEGPVNTTAKNWVDMLNFMVSSNQIRQFSSSWGFGNTNATGDQSFQTMALQGQSFFQASGDGGAFIYPVPWPGDSPYVTSVGGTTLTMNGNGVSYASETVWNSGFQATNNTWYANGSSGYWASGGGVSATYAIPSWQKGVNVSAVGGSTTKRNIPDVALTANQIWVNYFNGSSNSFFGTSCAAPLWAGFTALVNQQCAAHGRPPVGFLNPALYALGKNGGTSFHDITTGNSNWSTNLFYSAASGFDLCTGWGTPTASMISALENFAGAVWVDFSVAGPGAGTYENPYNTLALGIANVAVNGAVAIKGPSSTPVTLPISKPLILNASGGRVIIGQ
jgi:subtilase family serine protease